MNMKKYFKIFLSCLLLLLSFFLVACGGSKPEPENPGTNPENPGEEIVTYTVTFKDHDGTVLKTEEVNEGGAATAPETPKRDGYFFVSWDTNFSEVNQDLVVNAIYDSKTLDTRYTDSLKVDFDYEGKEFIKDGVGLVKVNRVVDGDTMSVYTEGESKAITIRFLGVDTPESTGSIEAWGKASSAYAKEVLYAAHSILLEAEGERLDSNGTRYLAWVWYQPTAGSDYRLFNLEEVELALSKYSQKVSSKYHEFMKAGNDRAKATGKRLWGEKDLDFNYSKDTIETNLLNLWYNHDNYQTGTYFYVTVRLVRTVGNNMFLEDAEEQTLELENGDIISGKGAFYAFWGYSAPYYRNYQIGDVFTMRCQVEWESDYGSQLTGISKTTYAKDEDRKSPEIPVIDANELGYSLQTVKDNEGNQVQAMASDLGKYFCKVITVTNLKCMSIKEKQTSGGDKYYVAVMENENHVQFDVYFGNDLITKWKLEEVLEVGKYYQVTGGVAYYQYANGYYQLSVGDAPRYSNGVLNQLDIERVNDIKEIIK